MEGTGILNRGDYTSYQLGRYLILRPLRVDLQEVSDGWQAYLNPAELTGHEWGWGLTAQEALTDLEEVVAEMKEHLEGEELGGELRGYKDLLNRCAVRN